MKEAEKGYVFLQLICPKNVVVGPETSASPGDYDNVDSETF